MNALSGVLAYRYPVPPARLLSDSARRSARPAPTVARPVPRGSAPVCHIRDGRR